MPDVLSKSLNYPKNYSFLMKSVIIYKAALVFTINDTFTFLSLCAFSQWIITAQLWFIQFSFSVLIYM